MKSAGSILWCPCLLVWLVVGCAPQQPLLRQDWHHRDGIEAFLGLAAADIQGLEDLRAEASITYQQAGRKERGTAVLLFKSPDLLRVEVRGPFYSHVFTALLQADSLIVFGSDGAWKGAARGSLLLQLIDIDLGLYDLRYALLGLVEPGRIDSSRQIEYPRADRAIIPLQGGHLPRRIWVDLHRGFTTREEIAFPDGEVLLSRRLKDYQKVGRLYLPGRVEIRQDEASLVLEYRNYIPDKGVPDKSFTQGIPLDRLQRVD